MRSPLLEVFGDLQVNDRARIRPVERSARLLVPVTDRERERGDVVVDVGNLVGLRVLTHTQDLEVWIQLLQLLH